MGSEKAGCFLLFTKGQCHEIFDPCLWSQLSPYEQSKTDHVLNESTLSRVVNDNGNTTFCKFVR